MKNIMLTALCALCIASFSSAAFAAANDEPEPGSAAEQILKSKQQPIDDAWQDDPTPFAY